MEFIILGLVLAVIWFFVSAQKKKIEKKTIYKHSLSVRLAKIIEQYNTALCQFENIVREKIELIQKYQDLDAAQKMTAIEQNFEVARAAANASVTEINAENFAGHTAEEVQHFCENIDKSLAEMYDYIDLLAGINPCQQDFAERPAESFEPVCSQSAYFAGCDTKEKISARFRSLAKVYHPDNNNGDVTTFRQVKQEYEQLLVRCQRGGES